MTTYSGSIEPSSKVWPGAAPNLSSNLFAYDITSRAQNFPQEVRASGALSAGGAGAFPSGVSVSGAVEPATFVKDYYDRIHVIPASIPLGNVANRVDRQFSIWNAYRTSKTLTGINASGIEGISLSGIPATPAVFGPLQYSTYTAQISTDGPASINAAYQFVFSSGDQPSISFTGNRVLLFPYPPNWSSPFTETIEWKSDVLRAWDGTEQRRACRVIPRRSFEYQFFTKGRATAKLESLLWGWHTRSFALPVWSDKTSLTSGVSVGTQTLPMLTDTYSFRAGDFAVIYQDEDTYEVVQIDSFTSSQINTKYPIQSSWPSGTVVYPVVVARLPTSVAQQRLTDDVISGRAIFNTSPEETYPYLPDATAPTTYDGLEVITDQPNWREAIDYEFSREFMTLDAGVGPVAYYDKEKVSRVSRPYAWFLKSRTEILNFRKFIQRMRGQVKTCWVPSWHDDFEVVGTTGSTSASLTIDGTEFADLVGVNTSRDRIMVRLNDGTIFYRKITTVTVGSGSTVLGLNANFGRTITPSDVKSVHLLLLCRFATDKIVIPWKTDRFADPQTPFITVPM